MKKEIKFKGQRIDTREWVYGYLRSEDEIGNFYVDINTIGQFTGLTDKNNNEIYCGDNYIDEDYDLWKVIRMTCGRYALQNIESGYVDEFISWKSIIIKN